MEQVRPYLSKRRQDELDKIWAELEVRIFFWTTVFMPYKWKYDALFVCGEAQTLEWLLLLLFFFFFFFFFFFLLALLSYYQIYTQYRKTFKTEV